MAAPKNRRRNAIIVTPVSLLLLIFPPLLLYLLLTTTTPLPVPSPPPTPPPPMPFLIHQASSQYNTRTWHTFPLCPSHCHHTRNITLASAIIAHPAKTALRRQTASQIWVADFWESPAHYPPLSLDYDYSISYHPRATFPKFHMMSDTFGLWPRSAASAPAAAAAAAAAAMPLVPWASKRRRQMMSVWVSNCGAGGARGAVLERMVAAGVTAARYGRCGRDARAARGDLGAAGVLGGWDGAEEMSGRQKMAHGALHLFMFAAENSVCEGYHTEKVFHALVAGSVPVYYGADGIDGFVPEGSVIKAGDFGTPEELARYLRRVAADERLYGEYLKWRERPLPERLRRLMERAEAVGEEEWKCGVCRFLRERGRAERPVEEGSLRCVGKVGRMRM